MLNSDETEIDCGGACPPCPLPATCNDGVLNGDETDIDCGGSCEPCLFTCYDGVLNADETDVDCGGECPPCPDEWLAFNTNLAQHLTKMHFINKNTGYVWSDISTMYWNALRVYKTIDGGVNWQQINLPDVGSGDYWYEFFPVAEDKLFVQIGNSNDSGKLAKSTDGGESWQLVNVPASFERNRNLMAFHDSQQGVMTHSSYEGTTYATIFYKTSDGGDTWMLSGSSKDWLTAMPPKDSITCNNLWAFSNGLTYAYSPGWRFVSQDFGATWEVFANTASPLDGTLEWATPEIGIMRGYNANTPASLLEKEYLYTQDGGLSWEKIFNIDYGLSAYTEFYFKDINQLIGYSLFSFDYAVTFDLTTLQQAPFGKSNDKTFEAMGVNPGNLFKCVYIENTSYCIADAFSNTAFLVLHL